jgi:ankyrin repeat protein
LLFAARNGDIKSSRILISAGADVNEAATDGMTPLLMATIRGQLAYAEFLLDQKANPDIATAGYTPLHRAAGEWNTLVTQRIGMATEDTNEWGVLGGMRGQLKLDFIKLLLARGANPNARTTKTPPRYGSGGGPRFGDSKTPLIGGTPFIFAAHAGDVPAMRLLLAAGADPKATTDDQTTALILAAGFGHNPDGSRVQEANALEAVKLLVELGVDVNATNDMDSTALHGAASRGANSIVQFLVDKGADLEAKNARGWTAMTYAEGIFQNNTIVPYPSTEALLSKMGAKPSPPGLVRHRNDEAGVVILGRRGQPGTAAKPPAK